ncbi:MAG: hypothetical protein BWK80_04670 [Desulfobacteraceae bacterium IS3]|nr:MAG: hypothetical protein BWK80_04670 [Desulfobacteraceae bacterium IS3]
MYYAIYDNQTDEIKHLGLNSNSLKEIRDSLISFLLDGNFCEEGEKSVRKSSLKNLLNDYEFSLLKSKTPFEI